MKAFWWVVREIYSLRETLTKNFEVNSTNVTESNERTNTRTNKRTYERTNGQTSRRKLYTPRHKCRGYKNYIPRGINAGGITRKEFAPRGKNSFFMSWTQMRWEAKIKNKRVASPESVPVHLKTTKNWLSLFIHAAWSVCPVCMNLWSVTRRRPGPVFQN